MTAPAKLTFTTAQLVAALAYLAEHEPDALIDRPRQR